MSKIKRLTMTSLLAIATVLCCSAGAQAQPASGQAQPSTTAPDQGIPEQDIVMLPQELALPAQADHRRKHETLRCRGGEILAALRSICFGPGEGQYHKI